MEQRLVDIYMATSALGFGDKMPWLSFADLRKKPVAPIEPTTMKQPANPLAFYLAQRNAAAALYGNMAAYWSAYPFLLPYLQTRQVSPAISPVSTSSEEHRPATGEFILGGKLSPL